MTGYRRGLRRTHSGLAPKTVETLIWRFMHKIFYFLENRLKKYHATSITFCGEKFQFIFAYFKIYRINFFGNE